MTKRDVSGQLNMFDFFRNMEPEDGEVEMVSLMPDRTDFEEQTPMESAKSVEKQTPKATAKSVEAPKAVEASRSAAAEKPVMHKEIRDAQGKLLGEISYLNYNKVYRQLPGEKGQLYEFDTSREAVEFYISEMWKLGPED